MADEPEEMSDAEKAEAEAAAAEAAEKAERTAREAARELLWAVMDDVNNGAVDTDEEKALRASIIEVIKEQVSAKMDSGEPAEPSEASEKAGRPQFSKARMGELMAAYDALGKVLESVNAVAAEEMAQKAAGDDAPDDADTPDAPDVEALTAQLAAKDTELEAATAEIASLKSAADAAARRAAPPATLGVEGQTNEPAAPPKKRINPLNMRIGQND
jgi:hypothetical protein